MTAEREQATFGVANNAGHLPNVLLLVQHIYDMDQLVPPAQYGDGFLVAQ